MLKVVSQSMNRTASNLRGRSRACQPQVAGALYAHAADHALFTRSFDRTKATFLAERMSWGRARTTRVHDETAVAPADRKPPALDAQAGDLALLQQVLQAREELDAPREAPLVRLPRRRPLPPPSRQGPGAPPPEPDLAALQRAARARAAAVLPAERSRSPL